jgi:arylsulfatase A-like enzyme
MHRLLPHLTLLAAVLALFAVAAHAATPARPNIVLILADDLGYMDIGANNPNTFYETPHIDALARRGMRFTQGYTACCVCSPTRASIMTGKYPPRTGVTDFIPGMRSGKLRSAPNADHLALAEVTVAEALREGGYATFFSGKWHLGGGEFSPNAQGFGPGLTAGDGAKGNVQFWYPPSATPPPDHRDDPKTTDRIVSDAVAFIGAHKNEPFFAYLPFLAVHTPIGARADLVAKYEKKKLSAPPDKWGRERERDVRLVQNHATYAAMLEQLDAGIGRVLAALETNGLTEHTVVVFLSDNGGLSTSEGHPTSCLPLRGGKGWPYEGGVRVPWIVAAPGLTKPGSTCDTPVITTDFYPTFLDLAGLPARPTQHRDGVSLVSLLKGDTLARSQPLYWHYPHYGNQGGAPHGAIRDGDWKLIEWYEDGALELYNVPQDIGEKTNLAATRPDLAKSLQAKLAAWRQEVGALMPTPNPDYNPNAKAVPAAKKNQTKAKS